MGLDRSNHVSSNGCVRSYRNDDGCFLFDRLCVGVVQVSALSTQVGGAHYREMKIQPIEFIHANNIPFIEANVIKYVCRWRVKNGVADLEKARHYIDLLIELQTRSNEDDWK